MPLIKPESFDTEMLSSIAEKLQKAAMEIQSGVTAMKMQGIQEISVTSGRQVRDAMKFARNFGQALQNSLEQKELEKRGLTPGKKAAEEQKPKRKKKGEQ